MIKKTAFIIVLILLLSPLSAYCYQKTMALTDREIIERLTRLEEGQKALQKEQKLLREEMNKRFEEMNRRFDERFDEMDKRITDLVHTANTIVIVFGGLVVAMIGLVFWDRRTLIEKAKEVTMKHIETDSRLIKVLKELSKTDKRLAEVMKTFGLL